MINNYNTAQTNAYWMLMDVVHVCMFTGKKNSLINFPCKNISSHSFIVLNFVSFYEALWIIRIEISTDEI